MSLRLTLRIESEHERLVFMLRLAEPQERELMTNVLSASGRLSVTPRR